MSTHLSIRTSLRSSLATAGLALALHSCADTAPQHPTTGDTDEGTPAATTPDESEGREPTRAVSGTGGGGQVLDGVPLGDPTPQQPPPPPPATGTAPATGAEPPARRPVPTKVSVVRANGTGCPQGEWSAAVAENGEIELAIDGFSAALESTDSSVAVRDCQLALSIDPGERVAFAVESIAYHGRATLSETAHADLTAKHYFQGDPAPGDANTRSFSGPFDADYQFVDQVAPERAIWSPCGGGRDLNLQTTLRVLGGRVAGTGSLSLGAIRGLRLSVRACTDEEANRAGAAAEPTETGGPRIISVTRE